MGDSSVRFVRTYGQYCGLARALDVVGDRWTMLLLRELAIRPCRYRDLRDGLPGIATNLLADRLRQLEADGVVDRSEMPPPDGVTLYRLTPLGRRLIPVLVDLAAWGSAWMAAAAVNEGRGTIGQRDDAFRGRWLVLAVPALLRDLTPSTPDMRVCIDTGDEAVVIDVTDGTLLATVDDGGPADLTITTAPEPAIALLTGQLSPEEAVQSGLAKFEGDEWAVAAFEALAAMARARVSVSS